MINTLLIVAVATAAIIVWSKFILWLQKDRQKDMVKLHDENKKEYEAWKKELRERTDRIEGLIRYGVPQCNLAPKPE